MTGTTKTLTPDEKANPGPPLDPEFGPIPVGVQGVVNDINDQTTAFDGMEIPVTIEYDDDDSFSIEVGVPPTAMFTKDEVGFDTGSGEPQEDFIVGMLIEQLRRVAKQKSSNLFSYNLKNTSGGVAGTCASLGVTAEDEDTRAFKQRIDGGNLDNYFDDE